MRAVERVGAGRSLAVAALVTMLASACADSTAPTPIPVSTASTIAPSGAPSGGVPSASLTSPTSSTAPSPSPASSGEASARVVFAAISPTVVFVRTPTGAGSGFAIDQRHIVTNAHVVRPFREATITLADGRTIPGATVVGWDLVGDLTVLQLPEAIAFQPAPVGDPDALAQGDRVYLVGYPMADLEQPTSTITEGVIAAQPFEWRDGLTYLATDAAIADGQSGGVLADAEGRLLGVTGGSRGPLAIALRIDDALRRVAGILAGLDVDGVPDRLLQPGPADAPRDARVTMRNRADERVWVVTGGQDDPAARIEMRADGPAIVTAMAAGGQLANGGGTAARQQSVSLEFGPPGPYLVKVDIPGPKAVKATLHATAGLTPLDDPDDGQAIRAGGRYEGVADYAGDLDWFRISLQTGQKVFIRVSASGFDPSLFIDQVSTDKTLAAGQDSGGPLGIDDELAFQTPKAGDYRIVVGDGSFIGFGAYRLEVFAR